MWGGKNIISDIKKGIKTKKYEIILDREKAIKRGIEIQGDKYLLILGKGDEQFIEKCDKKIPFSDKNIVLKYKE